MASHFYQVISTPVSCFVLFISYTAKTNEDYTLVYCPAQWLFDRCVLMVIGFIIEQFGFYQCTIAISMVPKLYDGPCHSAHTL